MKTETFTTNLKSGEQGPALHFFFMYAWENMLAELQSYEKNVYSFEERMTLYYEKQNIITKICSNKTLYCNKK